eukprot:2420680-Alexandrium_andersonii.AAC.1
MPYLGRRQRDTIRGSATLSARCQRLLPLPLRGADRPPDPPEKPLRRGRRFSGGPGGLSLIHI